ncbi:LacI family DNA-binding transcriptional regulator [Catenulispora subtropica]|uniref:LacI family DNA-binding transcriptional regulator n=1 Tax=Catenulispora subtropica TaxID=450798 RepID=A0ABP5DES7_9ACTN
MLSRSAWRSGARLRKRRPETSTVGPPARSRPTLEAVATVAGVSRATVSRVINGDHRVRADAAASVRAAIDQLGYVPNQAARSLVTRRTDAVAVVVAEPQERVFIDPFFGTIFRGVGKALAEHGLQFVLLLLEGTTDRDSVVRYLAGGHVDGALIFSLKSDDALPAAVTGLDLPAVFSGRPDWPRHQAGDDVLFVNADNRGGGATAARHLQSLGRSKIATITGPMDQAASVDRLLGFRDELPHLADSLIVEADFSRHGAARAMHLLLERHPDLDAVFVASDLMAAAALDVLREQGRRVPDDVAVVGFDGIAAVAERTSPPLTTIHQDIEKMGRLMVDLLTQAITGPGEPRPESITIPTRLVRRLSA